MSDRAGVAGAVGHHEPMAAASIGQAHRGCLPDGGEVVVKVRRPGVVERVEEDLEVIQELAGAASRRWERARDYDLVGPARELAEVLRSELDYVREGRSAERIASSFAGWPELDVPGVHWPTAWRSPCWRPLSWSPWPC